MALLRISPYGPCPGTWPRARKAITASEGTAVVPAALPCCQVPSGCCVLTQPGQCLVHRYLHLGLNRLVLNIREIGDGSSTQQIGLRRSPQERDVPNNSKEPARISGGLLGHCTFCRRLRISLSRALSRFRASLLKLCHADVIILNHLPIRRRAILLGGVHQFLFARSGSLAH